MEQQLEPDAHSSMSPKIKSTPRPLSWALGRFVE